MVHKGLHALSHDVFLCSKRECVKIFSFPLKVVKIDEVPFQNCEDSEPIGDISDLKTAKKAQNGPKIQTFSNISTQTES